MTLLSTNDLGLMLPAMMRMLAFMVAFLLLGQAPAHACRAPPSPPHTIVFPSVPRDVREDLLILRVTFVNFDAIPGSIPRITRARIDRVVQGTLTARDVYLISPFSGTCQTELQQGQRAYIVGRVHAPDEYRATFYAYETRATDQWQRPRR